MSEQELIMQIEFLKTDRLKWYEIARGMLEAYRALEIGCEKDPLFSRHLHRAVLAIVNDNDFTGQAWAYYKRFPDDESLADEIANGIAKYPWETVK